MIPKRKLALAQDRIYWVYQLSGWYIVATLLTLMAGSYTASGYGTMAVIYNCTAMSGIALSHGWRLILKKRGWFAVSTNPPWVPIGLSVLVLGIVQTIIAGLAFSIVRPVGMLKNWEWLPGAIFSWVIVFASWTALYSFMISTRRAKRFEAEALRLEIYAKDAELRALQAQVNPHFFFNSLNSVRALIFENQNAAAQMIDQLAGIMRYTLQSNENATVTLARELEAVNAYLAIERIRFEERLIVSINIEADLAETLIPPMAVQTLVENAVKYGVERNLAGSEIRITARRVTGHIEIEVANQGMIAPFENPGNSTQLGLENTRKRLAIMSSAKSELQLSQANGWVRAVISLPEMKSGGK